MRDVKEGWWWGWGGVEGNEGSNILAVLESHSWYIIEMKFIEKLGHFWSFFSSLCAECKVNY